MNADDEVRDAVLRHLYALHKNARGPRGIVTGIRDLQKGLKGQGFKAADVTSNLDYLVQKGWVKEVPNTRTYRTGGGTIRESTTVYYKISDIGIDKLQAASAYQRPDHTRTINITNVHGVTIVGDGNVVNTRFTDMSRALTELESAVQASDELTDEEKLNVLSDISTIQSQLQKPEPDKAIVSRAWSVIEKAANVGQLADIVAKIAPMVLSIAGAAV